MMESVENVNGVKYEGSEKRYGGMWVMWSLT